MKLETLIRNTLSLTESESISDEAGPETTSGWDSLGHVSLMSEIENTYSITIEMDEMMEIERVGDIRRILSDKGVVGF